MKVIGKDRTSCDVCNPIDEIIARLDALERRASAIVAKVQGIAPDGEGNVTLPTSSSDTDPLHGRVDAFAMSSEVKEAADDAHAYAASIADDVVVLRTDVENLTKEVEALDPASVTALEQSVAALQQSVNQLSNLVGGISAVIRDLEDQMPNKVDRTGDTMTGPLNVIDTVTGSRNTQAVNGNRLQNDLDNYAPMMRNSGNVKFAGEKISTTANGLGMETKANYNAFRIKSNSFYNTIIANKQSPDGKEDRGWRIESPYNTSDQNSLAITCYAPRATLGAAEETQQQVSLTLFAHRTSGVCRLVITAKLPDGSEHKKTLAEFSNGVWK